MGFRGREKACNVAPPNDLMYNPQTITASDWIKNEQPHRAHSA